MKHVNPIWPELSETPHHLVIWIHGMEVSLFDQCIAPPPKGNYTWFCGSGELWTPKGLPLHAQLSGKTGFSVYSAEALLLSVDQTKWPLHVRLLLPTDELLTADVEVRRVW